MSMEKRADSQEPIQVIIDTHLFKKGTQFAWDNLVWIVTEEVNDSGVDMRRIVNNQGGDEIHILSSLRKHITEDHDTFKLLESIAALQDQETEKKEKVDEKE